MRTQRRSEEKQRDRKQTNSHDLPTPTSLSSYDFTTMVPPSGQVSSGELCGFLVR